MFSYDFPLLILISKILTNLSVNSKLSKKDLTCKLTVLLTLSSVLRVSSIHHLNINFMATTKSCYKFYFNKPHKSYRKNQATSVVTYQEYTQDERLWVARNLDEHIAQKENWGLGEKHSQLLLSFIHPHKLMVSNTKSGWLATILMKSAVDSGILKAHSKWSASTSKASLIECFDTVHFVTEILV